MPRRDFRIVSLALVCLPVLFNLICLYPELSISRRALNDQVFQLAASQRMSQALTSGENPVDAWVGTGMGTFRRKGCISTASR